MSLNKNIYVRKELYKVIKKKIFLECGCFTLNGTSKRGFEIKKIMFLNKALSVLSITKRTSSIYHCELTCSHHDIDAKLLSWH